MWKLRVPALMSTVVPVTKSLKVVSYTNEAMVGSVMVGANLFTVMLRLAAHEL